ncbi:hypothetical protein LVJ94_39580 [Pendulispora rubella]|uniref:Fe2OG dioxygenase domain-containing protein n=1 Tax=Pendulispora rubella TaxID=2741070 RepID=A0ABZ2L2Y3_9BACT
MMDDPNSPLMMNPFVDIHVHPQPKAHPIDVDRIQTICVKNPVRGRGLVVRDLTRATDPALFQFFSILVERGGEIDLDSHSPVVAALVDIGFLVRDEEIVDWPRFEVPLDDVPAKLARDDAWVVADTFLFQPEFGLHPHVRWPADYDEQEGRLHGFASGPAFWVGVPSALVSPFWVDPAAAAILAELVPGRAPPPLPPLLARSLASAGALVSRDRSPADPLESFAQHRAAFASERHTIVRDLLSAPELRALRRYYAAVLQAGLLARGDRQNASRFSSYNDTIARFVHARLTGIMSAVVGQPVQPSFSYFFSYVDGAELLPHKDRPQAELSISLQLDYHPEPAAETGWPLSFSFDRAGGQPPAHADLRIGDAVFYHGRELTHYRRALPAGHQSSHIVLEYVPLGFHGLLV